MTARKPKTAEQRAADLAHKHMPEGTDMLTFAMAERTALLAERSARARMRVEMKGKVLIPKAALDWLMGEGDDFVCPPDRFFRGKAPPYWWRTEFRRRIKLENV